MKQYWVGIAVIGLFMFQWSSTARSEDKRWKKVHDAERRELPETAILTLNEIYEASLSKNHWGEAIRALCKKLTLEASKQQDKAQYKITRIETLLPKLPREMQPVLNTVLAHWYWEYLRDHNDRIIKNTLLAQPVGDELATWDLQRLVRHIDAKFREALSYSEELKKIPVEQYLELLEKGTQPNSYRPTLYDVVAYSALEFYEADVQVANVETYPFEIKTNDPIFGSQNEFLEWKPEAQDPKAIHLHAIELYQDLIRFHEKDKDKHALLDADLNRLSFGHTQCNSQAKTICFIRALERFAAENSRHDLASTADAMIAEAWMIEDDRVAALEFARRGAARFPESVGGLRCSELIREIESPSWCLSIERTWNPTKPTCSVQYCNLKKLYFRIVPYSFNNLLEPERYFSPSERKLSVLDIKPVLSWDVELPKTMDYQKRSEVIKVPEILPSGSYYIIASDQADFPKDSERLSTDFFWISQSSIVIQQVIQNPSRNLRGIVINAISGEPLSNAVVKFYGAEHKRPLRLAGETTSDENGVFELVGQPDISYTIHATHPVGDISSDGISAFGPHVLEQVRKSTILFTDRAIYRPGQTVHYKGICVSSDTKSNRYETIPKTAIRLELHNDRQLIESHNHVTNDFGSFSGSFTAPMSRSDGVLALIARDGPSGYETVHVAEYKRPKFQAKLHAPKGPKLNSPVSLSGEAIGYAGTPIDKAKVSWRVLCNSGTMPRQISCGVTTTDAKGNFQISFNATVDASLAERIDSQVHFIVSADITDRTGETRSAAREFAIGCTALRTNLHLEEWQTSDRPVELNLTSQCYEGKGEATPGKLSVYRLKEPEHIHPIKLWGYHLFETWGTRRVSDGQGEIKELFVSPPSPDLSKPADWELGDKVHEQSIKTNDAGELQLKLPLSVGCYRAKVEFLDGLNMACHAEKTFMVIDPAARKLAVKVPDVLLAPKWSVNPGETFFAIVGSGYESSRAYVEIVHNNRIIQSYWTPANETQTPITVKVSESMCGGFMVHVTRVRENRAYLHSQIVQVPWTNKQLNVRWEHFVSKLEPGKREKWSAIITGPDAKNAVAEMVATLYDASLDSFVEHDSYTEHDWEPLRHIFRSQWASYTRPYFSNIFLTLAPSKETHSHGFGETFVGLPREFIGRFEDQNNERREIIRSIWCRNFLGFGGHGGGGMCGGMPAPVSVAAIAVANANAQLEHTSKDGVLDAGKRDNSPANLLANVKTRANLQETAFFFPHLVSNSDGEVRIEFEIPEALTKWKFLAFAHDNQLRHASFVNHVITTKDLMVEPNPPRFLREGDELEFVTKVTNRSPTRQSGRIQLKLFDDATGEPVLARFGLENGLTPFEIMANGSQTFAWKLKVPKDARLLRFEVVGTTSRFSDGETGLIPVLSRQTLVTESMTMTIRGPGVKVFELKSLSNASDSKTLQHHELKLEMTSNPSWYALLSLPYLMEYPHDCFEQRFNKFYANAIASHLLNRDPAIRKLFDRWLSDSTTLNAYSRNPQVNDLLLEESPWFRDAKDIALARHDLALLFDEHHLNQQKRELLEGLREGQLSNGGWPWFSGNYHNQFITLYILAGFGRLRQMGIDFDGDIPERAIDLLDDWIKVEYQRALSEKSTQESAVINREHALYLYARSFFLSDKPIAEEHQKAVDFWQQQAQLNWKKLPSRMSQAHIAIALHRVGKDKTAKAILNSLKESSHSDPDLGMFWVNKEKTWWWQDAPIETQAMMIEAFDEIAKDEKVVTACQIWLLRQKQRQHWESTKAAADAVYALLARGKPVYISEDIVTTTVGNEVIVPKNVEAGPGYYEHRWNREAIKSSQAKVTLRKQTPGEAWGRLQWQYLEDTANIKISDSKALKLEKYVYVKRHSAKGPVLEPLDARVSVGDEIVMRLVLKSEQEMEFVHIKDQRAAGVEPIHALSDYHYRNKLFYYQTTRDSATHFFIDSLPAGSHVIEYSAFIQNRGKYQSGIAIAECMYAPEFRSHSESFLINVK